MQGEVPPPKCKNATTRKAALDLLVSLCRHRPGQAQILVKLLQKQHNVRSKDGTRLGNDIPEMRSATGFVGLRNLGATCYMNSSLQQFYMIPAFRSALIECSRLQGGGSSSAVGASGSKSGDAGSDQAVAIVGQLAQLFTQLQESERRFVDPTPFIECYRDPYGQAIDPRVQCDANEFLTAFFQHVENATSGTSMAGMLKGNFQGTVSDELLQKEADSGSGVRQYREKAAVPFSFLSVPVNGLARLEDSLSKFVEAESVELRWNDGAPNAPVSKRCSIVDLPNHLMIHLQRFQFDYQTMAQVKINDHFEFPLELDMLPYCKAGRPDRWPPEGAVAETEGSPAGADSGVEALNEKDAPMRPRAYYEYTLRGIVVHDGTAQAGHYYSYSCDRECAKVGGAPRWFEFNDKQVRPFDVAKLAEAAFGGEQEITFSDTNYWGETKTTTKKMAQTANAFILVYDRRQLDQLLPAPSRAAVPRAQLQKIWADNARFARLQQTLNPVYFAFVESLIGLPVIDPALLTHHRGVLDQQSPLVQLASLCQGAQGSAGRPAAIKHAAMIFKPGDRVKAFLPKFGKWFSGAIREVHLTNGGSYVVDFDDNTWEEVPRHLVTRETVRLPDGAKYTEGEEVLYSPTTYSTYYSTYSAPKRKKVTVTAIQCPRNTRWVYFDVRAPDGRLHRMVEDYDLKEIPGQNICDVYTEAGADIPMSPVKAAVGLNPKSKRSRSKSPSRPTVSDTNSEMDKALMAALETAGRVPFESVKLAVSVALGTLCYSPTTKMRALLPTWLERLSFVLRAQPSELSVWVVESLSSPWEDEIVSNELGATGTGIPLTVSRDVLYTTI